MGSEFCFPSRKQCRVTLSPELALIIGFGWWMGFVCAGTNVRSKKTNNCPKNIFKASVWSFDDYILYYSILLIYNFKMFFEYFKCSSRTPKAMSIISILLAILFSTFSNFSKNTCTYPVYSKAPQYYKHHHHHLKSDFCVLHVLLISCHKATWAHVTSRQWFVTSQTTCEFLLP